MQPESETPSADFAMMSEDEQIAYAMRMSLQAEGAVHFYSFSSCNVTYTEEEYFSLRFISAVNLKTHTHLICCR